MKDLGFGVIDRHTIVGALFTMVIAQVLLGFRIPVDTSSADQLFIDLIILTGYIYIALSIFRLPIAIPASLTITRIHLLRPFILWGWSSFKPNKHSLE